MVVGVSAGWHWPGDVARTPTATTNVREDFALRGNSTRLTAAPRPRACSEGSSSAGRFLLLDRADVDLQRAAEDRGVARALVDGGVGDSGPIGGPQPVEHQRKEAGTGGAAEVPAQVGAAARAERAAPGKPAEPGLLDAVGADHHTPDGLPEAADLIRDAGRVGAPVLMRALDPAAMADGGDGLGASQTREGGRSAAATGAPRRESHRGVIVPSGHDESV